MDTNYYDIFGITETERYLPFDKFSALLKKKWREVALKYHPDKHADKSEAEKKAAEEKFKEASEAYEVLSNQESKMRYDLFGNTKTNSHAGPQTGTARKKTASMTIGHHQRIRVVLTLKELYVGGSKTVQYHVRRKCPKCNGVGGSNPRPCPECGGTGHKSRRTWGFGSYQEYHATCAHCLGSGVVFEKTCTECDGVGQIEALENITVGIPTLQEIVDGEPNIIRGKGHSPVGGGNGINGDLIYNFGLEEPSDGWRIDDDLSNLRKTVEVPWLLAILGGKTQMTHIDGTILAFTLKPCTQNHAVLRIAGKGLPKRDYSRGDLYIVVDVVMPEKLDDGDRSILEQLKDRENFKEYFTQK